MKTRTVRIGIFILAGGVLLVTAAIIFSDFRQVAAQMQHIDWRYVPWILLLIPLNYCIKWIRYHYYLRLAHLRVRARDELYSLLAASVMVVTPGKLGEVFLRGYLLQVRHYAISLVTICAMALADRLTEGLAMAVMAVVTISCMGLSGAVQTGAVYLVIGGMLALVFLLQHKDWCRRIFCTARKLPHAGKIVDYIEQAYLETYVIFTVKPMLLSILLGIISWSCEAGVVYISLLALGERLAFSKIVFAISLSGLLGALSTIPGGVGVADGTLLGLLVWCGLESGIAGVVTILSRFSTMWLGVILGCALLWKNRAELSNLLRG